MGHVPKSLEKNPDVFDLTKEFKKKTFLRHVPFVDQKLALTIPRNYLKLSLCMRIAVVMIVTM
jgi:hypothetical protein